MARKGKQETPQQRGARTRAKNRKAKVYRADDVVTLLDHKTETVGKMKEFVAVYTAYTNLTPTQFNSWIQARAESYLRHK